MFKVARNRRTALLLARVLLVCSLFVMGLAPSSRADDFKYTVTMDPTNRTGLFTSFSFQTKTLIGSDLESIDPHKIHMLEGPLPGSVLESFSIDNQSLAAHFVQPCSVTERCEEGIVGAGDDWTDESAHLISAMTSPGTYQFDFMDITNLVVAGGGVDQNDRFQDGSVTLLVTPKPKSGLESRVGQFSSGASFSDDGFIGATTYRQHEIDVTAVQRTPEPSSLLLLFIGLAALAFYVPRKMDKTQRLA